MSPRQTIGLFEWQESLALSREELVCEQCWHLLGLGCLQLLLVFGLIDTWRRMPYSLRDSMVELWRVEVVGLTVAGDWTSSSSSSSWIEGV